MIRANAVDVEEGKRNQMPEVTDRSASPDREQNRGNGRKDYGRLLLWMIPSGKLPE